MNRDEELELTFDLINAFRVVKTPAETALLLRDLLTAKEIKNLANRLRIAKLLLAEETERDIRSKLRTSFATITKVRAWLNQGGEGLREVISKLPPKYNIPKDLPKMPVEYQFPKVILALANYASNKLLEKFEEGVKDKRNLDKSLQKIFNEYYKERKASK